MRSCTQALAHQLWGNNSEQVFYQEQGKNLGDTQQPVLAIPQYKTLEERVKRQGGVPIKATLLPEFGYLSYVHI